MMKYGDLWAINLTVHDELIDERTCIPLATD